MNHNRGEDLKPSDLPAFSLWSEGRSPFRVLCVSQCCVPSVCSVVGENKGSEIPRASSLIPSYVFRQQQAHQNLSSPERGPMRTPKMFSVCLWKIDMFTEL